MKCSRLTISTGVEYSFDLPYSFLYPQDTPQADCRQQNDEKHARQCTSTFAGSIETPEGRDGIQSCRRTVYQERSRCKEVQELYGRRGVPGVRGEEHKKAWFCKFGVNVWGETCTLFRFPGLLQKFKIIYSFVRLFVASN
jgi:hypothetical protein